MDLLLCSVPPPLYFGLENSLSTRNELARPVMGTIFLVCYRWYYAPLSPTLQLQFCEFSLTLWVTPLPLACEVHNILQVRSCFFDSFFFHAIKHERLSIDIYGQIGYVFVPCVERVIFNYVCILGICIGNHMGLSAIWKNIARQLASNCMRQSAKNCTQTHVLTSYDILL